MTTPPTSQTNPLDPVFSGVPVVFPQTGMINPTWNKWFVDLRQKLNVINAETATPVVKVHAGTNVTVDNTDPQNPVVSSSGGALPSGGTAGQVLTKIDSTPGNADWQTPSGGGSSNYLVPPFANVLSLLHFDGTNGSTVFTDQVSGNTWTASNATISTTQYLFGGASGLFTTGGSNSCITMPTNASFQIGAANWTLEISCYLTSTVGANVARLFQTNQGDGYTGISLAVNPGNVLVLYMSSSGTGWNFSNANIASLANNTWYRILVQRYGGVVSVYINGNFSTNISVSGSLYTTISDTLGIGGQSTGTNRSFPGYIDEFRFTGGLALVSSYQVTTAEFPNS